MYNKGQFAKGHTPWTKGRSGIHLSLATEFQVGHRSVGGVKFEKGHPPTLGFSGRKHSEITKQKMSLSAKARGFTLEQRRKITEALKGRIASEEHKAKMALIMQGNQYRLGFLHSKETRQEMSRSRLGVGNGNWRGGTSFFESKLKSEIEILKAK